MALERRGRHRRDWRRLWLYCRCGHRWICPDSPERIPKPFQPYVRPMTEAEYRAGMAASSPVPRIVYRSPSVPPPPAPRWTTQGADIGYPLWNSPSGRHQIGRAGALTPAQTYRGRYGERRSAPTGRVGRT